MRACIIHSVRLANASRGARNWQSRDDKFATRQKLRISPSAVRVMAKRDWDHFGDVFDEMHFHLVADFDRNFVPIVFILIGKDDVL